MARDEAQLAMTWSLLKLVYGFVLFLSVYCSILSSLCVIFFNIKESSLVTILQYVQIRNHSVVPETNVICWLYMIWGEKKVKKVF